MTGAAPLHLAIFIRSLGGGGGAERMMVNLASCFADLGHRVDLVLGRVEGAFVRDIPSSVRLVDLGGHTVLPALLQLAREPATACKLAPILLSKRPPWILGCLPALVRYLQAERPDAMLSALNATNITAVWGRRVAGVATRLVVSERNTLSQRAAGEPGLGGLPKVVARFYPEADAIAAVSDGVAEDLARTTGIARDSIHTTYNPVVTPDIEELAREPLAHPWFSGDGSASVPLILGAGKLKRQKDFLTLIDAFARVRAKRPVRLMILGEGPQRARLEARSRELGIQESVAMPGFVANPFAYMARASLFALSSAWEGLPGVLVQALACGCPAVATDCPNGPREILDEGAYGPLVPVGDADALAAALAQVLEQPPAAERLRERAQMFSAERVAARYLALLAG